MQNNPDSYNIGNKFKIAVFLTEENTLRTVHFARHFAKSLEVVYVTCESSNLEPLYHPNIRIFDFNKVLNRINNLIFQFNCYRLYQKIEAIRKSYELSYKDILLFVNSLNYTAFLEYFPDSTIHFDLNNTTFESISEKVMNERLLFKINSVTTNKTNIRKDIRNYFNSVYRIPDGIEADMYSESNIKDSKLPSPVIGCFTSQPQNLDYELLFAIAKKHPDYSFLFTSTLKFPETPEKLRNLHLKTVSNSLLHYDYILLPLIESSADSVNRLFYENLLFPAPVLSLRHEELETHNQILHLYSSFDSLLEALENIRNIRNVSQLEKDVLMQNISWNSRSKQVESVILASL